MCPRKKNTEAGEEDKGAIEEGSLLPLPRSDIYRGDLRIGGVVKHGDRIAGIVPNQKHMKQIARGYLHAGVSCELEDGSLSALRPNVDLDNNGFGAFTFVQQMEERSRFMHGKAETDEREEIATGGSDTEVSDLSSVPGQNRLPS